MSEESIMKSKSTSVNVSVNLNCDEIFNEDKRRFRVVLVINGSMLGQEFITKDALEALQKYYTWCHTWGVGEKQ